jgi:HAD superfamily hydrolase (TIGR01549 family)
MRFLVTCGGGIQAIGLINDLRKVNQAVIYVCGWNEININAFEVDGFFVSPPVSSGDLYIQFLVDLCKNKGINHVIPATSLDIKLLSNKKALFSSINVHCLLPDIDVLEICLSKEIWGNHFHSLGVSMPRVFNANDNIQFPVIAKQKSAWGSRGICIYNNPSDLVNFNWDPDYFVSEYIEDAVEYSLDFFVSTTGKITGPLSRRRELVSGGFALVSKWVTTPECILKEWLKLVPFFAKPSCNGYFNIQFLEKNDAAFLIDVNPRIGTSATFSSSNIAHGLLNSSIQNNALVSNSSSGKIIRRLYDIALPEIKLSNVQIVLFDLDDTLISNLRYILSRCELLHDLVYANCVDKKEFMDFCKALLISGKAFELIDRIYHQYSTPLSHQEVLKKYQDCLPEKTHVHEGVEELLIYLSNKGYHLAIYSSSSQKQIKHKIETSILKSYIHTFYSTEELPEENKTSFAVIKKNMNKLSSNMFNVVMVGDHFFEDIQGAINAGCQAAFYVHQPNGLIPEIEVGDEYIKSGVIKIPKLNYLKNYL